MKNIFRFFVLLSYFSYISSLRLLQSLEDTLVLRGWAFDVNSKVVTDDIVPRLSNLYGRNITDVVATEQAFAVRIALNISEAAEATARFIAEKNFDAHNKPVADGSRPLATYVIWGESNYGGTVPADRLDFLKGSSTWPSEIATSGVTFGHVIYANDICPLKDAFVAISNGRLACWGNDETCTGWDTIIEERPNLQILKVLCAVNGYAAIPILNNILPSHGAAISVFGRPSFGGQFTTTTEFMDAIRSMDTAAPLQFLGNAYAVAMLLQGGEVLAWGEPLNGGLIPSNLDAVFVDRIYANGIGFTAKKTTRKIISWGNFPQQYIPERIRDIGGTAQVLDVIPGHECFLAMLEGGSVAIWGGGDQLFCNEEGAGGSQNYNSYLSVKADLQTDVVSVVLNKWAFAAVKLDGSVVMWGHKSYGGSKIPPLNSDYWDPADIHSVVPDTLVATCCAFGFIRNDGRGVAWGHDEYGGRLAKQYATIGIIKLSASNDTMAVIDRLEGLIRWQGGTAGYFQKDSPFPDFKLNYPPRFLFHTTGGMMVVMGEDCTYTSWSSWSSCSVECGGGNQTRFRRLQTPALNGVCSYSFTEDQSCNTDVCVTELRRSAISEVSAAAWVGIGFGSLAVLGLLFYGIFAFCKRQPQDPYL